MKWGNAVLGAVAVTGLCVVFLPTVFGERSTDVWAKWIYDFQSLFGGLFAVVAAYLTVRQMRESDEQQSSRHRELMELNLRKDKLIIQKAYDPQVAELYEANIFLNRYVEFIVFKDHTHGTHPAIEGRHDFLRIVRSVEDVLQREQILQVKPFLDQKGLRALQMVAENLSIVLPFAQEMVNVYNLSQYYDEQPRFDFDCDWDDNEQYYQGSVSNLMSAIEVLISNLTDLHTSYARISKSPN